MMPTELQDAFDAYERALARRTTSRPSTTRSRPARSTLRGDSNGLLVGHDAISAFRSARGGITPRVLDRVESRRLADDCWLIVATLPLRRRRHRAADAGVAAGRRAAGGSPPRTSPAARPASTRSVWRTVGDPLYQGAFDGPLLGLRVAVKDVFAVRGYRIGAGNPTWLRDAARERQHAPAVLDLLKAGASVRGLARTDELAYSIAGANPHYGTPANGAVPGALPGGSSSGPATAVATGQADVGLASDTAGSVRVPASYQGLWGLRTTHGLVPRQGMVPLAPSFDTVGWLTRDGATLDAVVTWCLEDDAPPAPVAPAACPAEVLAAGRAGDPGGVRGLVRAGPSRRSRSARSTSGSRPSAWCRPRRRGGRTAPGSPRTPTPSDPACASGSRSRAR